MCHDSRQTIFAVASGNHDALMQAAARAGFSKGGPRMILVQETGVVGLHSGWDAAHEVQRIAKTDLGIDVRLFADRLAAMRAVGEGCNVGQPFAEGN